MDDHNPRLICPATQRVLRDEWYVVAFAHEVDDKTPLARYCCGDRIVLFRTAQGTPVALYDRCPHRGSPLSLGKITEDTLQCPYHGFRYGITGQCVRVPSQTAIIPELAVRSYPVIEKGGFIWLWPGTPERADPAKLPDCHEFGLDRPDWTAKPYLMLEIKANYALLFENLLDTSHISFLHGTALDGGRMASSTFHLESDGRSVASSASSPAIRRRRATPGNTACAASRCSIASWNRLPISRTCTSSVTPSPSPIGRAIRRMCGST
jgi:vanillate O-demethylase monooxygenase subunit